MNNYKIPKRARKQAVGLTGQQNPPENENGVTQDPKDNMEQVSILQQEDPPVEMKWVVQNESASTHWTRSVAHRSTDSNNDGVNPATSTVSPLPGNSQSSSSPSSEATDVIPSVEIKQEYLIPAVEVNQEDLPSDDTDDDTIRIPMNEPDFPLSPFPSSTTSGYTSSENGGLYSPMDMQETSDDESTDIDDDGNDEEANEDVLIVGLSRRERKEVDCWDKLLSRRNQQ